MRYMPIDSEIIARQTISKVEDLEMDNERAQVLATVALAEAVLTLASAIHHKEKDNA